MKWSHVLEAIEADRPAGGEWCTDEKAGTLAALIIGLRPKMVVEIGVWMGGSLLPMAMALKALPGNEPRKIIGIDPWSSAASVAGQNGANKDWWSTVDHEAAFDITCRRLGGLGSYAVVSDPKLGTPAMCEIWQMSSSDVPMHTFQKTKIDLLHIDGNHAEQAIYDVAKFSPYVSPGGIVVMDDIGWDGGYVGAACKQLLATGFAQLYTLDTGAVFQRQGMRP